MLQYDKSFDQGKNFFHICWGYLDHLKLCCNILFGKKNHRAMKNKPLYWILFCKKVSKLCWDQSKMPLALFAENLQF